MHLHVFLFLDSLGGGELLIIMLFAIMFFGSEKLPGLMRGMGAAMRTFKNAMNDVKYDIEKSVDMSETDNTRKNLPKPGTTPIQPENTGDETPPTA
jgi:TatA/E family protein of Tat protein translocase